MQIRFLLGPAGSGKTFRCLAEIRQALRSDPGGPPLLLVAPKQATFQLERQLLETPEPRENGDPRDGANPHRPADDGALAGYTRLRILSFERLAEFVLDELGAPRPNVLSDAGRRMVLRALLARERDRLELFHSTALLPGFARQLGDQLREFQRYGFSPSRLMDAARQTSRPELRAKLHDLALLFDAARHWNQEHRLEDPESLLDIASEALGRRPMPALNRPVAQSPAEGRAEEPVFDISGLWLDGFAEMTPQELKLLAAILPHCDRACLAFCLDVIPEEEPSATNSWLSQWAVVRATFQDCKERVQALPGAACAVELLPRSAGTGRFSNNPVLGHLEASWDRPRPVEPGNVPRSSGAGEEPGGGGGRVSACGNSLRFVVCTDAEAEATLAACEILRFTRNGGRYREAAVLVRRLDRFQQPVERAFRRFEIPFFLDQRKPAAHHPLAELTRGALRTLAFGWQQEDWFGALKTGLVPADEAALDWLENEALARGWKGPAWREPLRMEDRPDLERTLEVVRKKIVAPFQELERRIAALAWQPDGPALAGALSRLWEDLGLRRRFEEGPFGAAHGSVDATVWEQMNEWLEMIAISFPHHEIPLRDWLPILEAGLADLTVGVIPPALDQVLVGAVDRSRNPDLKLVLALGLNESMFPAAPEPSALLTETDKDDLGASARPRLGPDLRQRLSRERYYAYIAFTRARRRLVVSCSEQDDHGQPLNPSTFIARLQALFPDLNPERFSEQHDWQSSEHITELIPALLRGEAAPTPELARLPRVASVLTRWDQWRSLPSLESLALSPGAVRALYGDELRSSISALEQFAACPFQFFINCGLRAGERKQFEADPRQTGSFQHEILNGFHRQLEADNKRWRDISPLEARERIARIGDELTPSFAGGLFRADGKSRFLAGTLIGQLQDFIEAAVGWMSQYDFDPGEVELSFGLKKDELPAWNLDLGGGRTLVLRGKIDRIDLCRDPGTSIARLVIIDYKSSPTALDPVLLQHGLELQLLSYLGALRRLADPKPFFDASKLAPAGAFYAPLRGRARAGNSRGEVLENAGSQARPAFQHSGVFDASALRWLDNSGARRGTQFKYSKNLNGEFSKRGNDALPPEAFTGLLDQIERDLRRHGSQIFAGQAAATPYRKGNQRACEFCACATICRFDPWVNSFHVLRKLPKPGDGAEAPARPANPG